MQCSPQLVYKQKGCVTRWLSLHPAAGSDKMCSAGRTTSVMLCRQYWAICDMSDVQGSGFRERFKALCVVLGGSVACRVWGAAPAGHSSQMLKAGHHGMSVCSEARAYTQQAQACAAYLLALVRLVRSF